MFNIDHQDKPMYEYINIVNYYNFEIMNHNVRS